MSRYGYQCIAGDTFDLVALHVYGDEAYAYELMNANPCYVKTGVFNGGEILVIPDISSTEQAKKQSNAPWRRE